jgi:hypothetical protein
MLKVCQDIRRVGEEDQPEKGANRNEQIDPPAAEGKIYVKYEIINGIQARNKFQIRNAYRSDPLNSARTRQIVTEKTVAPASKTNIIKRYLLCEK